MYFIRFFWHFFIINDKSLIKKKAMDSGGDIRPKKQKGKKTWNAIFFMGNLPVLLIFFAIFSGKRFHTLISIPFHNSTISVFIPFWYYDYYNGFFRINYMIEWFFSGPIGNFAKFWVENLTVLLNKKKITFKNSIGVRFYVTGHISVNFNFSGQGEYSFNSITSLTRIQTLRGQRYLEM